MFLKRIQYTKVIVVVTKVLLSDSNFKILSTIILKIFWMNRMGVGKIILLKLVRITLETSNLARKYTHMCSFRK